MEVSKLHLTAVWRELGGAIAEIQAEGGGGLDRLGFQVAGRTRQPIGSENGGQGLRQDSFSRHCL